MTTPDWQPTQVPAGRPRLQARRSRWPKVLLAVLLVPVILFAAFVGLLWFQVHGGWPGLRAGLVASPRPDDPAVSEAKTHALQVIETDLAALRISGEFTPDLRKDDDSCRRGQHNWKVNDDHAWKCSMYGMQLFAFSGGFHETVFGLGGRLAADGWEDDLGIHWVLSVYGDRTTVDQLPPAIYTRAGTQLSFGFVEKRSVGPILGLEDWPDGAAAAEHILRSQDYVLVVGYSRDYYQS